MWLLSTSSSVSCLAYLGHFAASLDPLSSPVFHKSVNVERKAAWLPDNPLLYPDIVKLLRNYPNLDLSPFGLDNVPRDKQFYLGDEVRTDTRKQSYSIDEVVDIYRRSYCGHVGVEIAHIENTAQREWLLRQFGNKYGPNNWSISHTKEAKLKILRRLMQCDHTGALTYRPTLPYSTVAIVPIYLFTYPVYVPTHTTYAYST